MRQEDRCADITLVSFSWLYSELDYTFTQRCGVCCSSLSTEAFTEKHSATNALSLFDNTMKTFSFKHRALCNSLWQAHADPRDNISFSFLSWGVCVTDAAGVQENSNGLYRDLTRKHLKHLHILGKSMCTHDTAILYCKYKSSTMCI